MKYLLMMHAPRGTGDYEIYNWPPEDFAAHMAHLERLNRELREAGEWVAVQALLHPARRSWCGQGGTASP
jgi:hypothetical protein